MTLDNVLALLARVPVRNWPMLMISLVRVSGEIEAALREGRAGWICYDLCGRVWLDLYPAPTTDWRDDLAAGLAPARRRLACALCSAPQDRLPAGPPDRSSPASGTAPAMPGPVALDTS